MTAQELYEIVRKEIDARASTDPALRQYQRDIQNGNGDFTDSAKCSQILAEILGDKLAKHILELPPNEGRSEVCQRLLKDHFDEISRNFEQVQSNQDRKNGINLNTKIPKFPAERAKKAGNSLEDTTVSDETIQRRCRNAVSNVANTMHDSFIQENAKFRNDAGLEVEIVRTAGAKACQWCAEVAGTYDVQGRSEAFRRHDKCHCILIYRSGKKRTVVLTGSTKSWQEKPDVPDCQPFKLTQEQAQELERNQLNRITRYTPEQAREIEAERLRELGLTTGGNGGRISTNGEEIIRDIFSQFDKENKDSSPVVDSIIENHEYLGSFTPESMKEMLEDLGYEVKPLGGKSSLKGIPFEEGGGYRTAFGGDGYFQYHPSKNSHHDGEYWKVGNGERGMHRYEMDGTPKIK